MPDEPTNKKETITELSATKFLEGVPPGEARQLAADTWEFPQHGFPTFTGRRWSFIVRTQHAPASASQIPALNPQ
jgi:hypothetical protein